jgi:hypothetical protein
VQGTPCTPLNCHFNKKIGEKIMLSSSDKLVLHPFSSYHSKRWEKILSFFILLLLVILVAVLVETHPEVLKWTTEDWMQWLFSLQDKPMILLQISSFLLSFLSLVYFYLAHHRERIFLTSSGIRYQSPLPSFLQWLKPDWSMKWSQIKAAYFKPARLKMVQGPLSMSLVLESAFFSKKIVPCAWIDPNDSEETRPALQQWQKFSPRQTKHVLPYCPIIKYLTKRGIDVKMDQVENALQAQSAEFALESNRHSLAAAILFFTLLAYALLDFLINQETYADFPFYNIYIYIGSGVFMAIIVMGWLRRAKVPKRESIIVALLLGGVFGVALYPGLLRLNQLTDTQGLQIYQYVLQKDYSLKPLDSNALPIHLC